MVKKYYLDTSIWLDYYLKRGKNGEAALKLILSIIEKDNIIIYSDFLVVEIKRLGFSQGEIHGIFRIVKPDNIKRVHLNKNQFEEALKLAKQRLVPKADAVHAVIARDNETQLISRDGHFEQLKDITKAKIPEDFI